MLSGLRWLALEVKELDPVATCYREHFDLSVVRADETEVVLTAGETQLILRRPSGVPRGGLHVHYAFATAADAYQAWWDRLAGSFDLEEHTFGSMRSLYLYDPAGNCVEIGGRNEPGSGENLTGLFEVVLEVEDLDTALTFYRALDFELVDLGDQRRRARLTAGPFDIELWEPHLGLADARGGVHVDIGLAVEDVAAIRDAVGDRATRIDTVDAGLRIRDPDGHYLTFG